jgi:thiosulfate dehydrogenase
MRTNVVVSIAVIIASAGVALARDGEPPKHALPVSPNGDLVVGLCDGETSLAVPGVKNGQAMSIDQAQRVSRDLMSQWKQKHPRSRWDEEERLAQNGPVPAAPAAAPQSVPATAQPLVQEGQTYGFTRRDEEIWRAATEAFVKQGDAWFHDAKALGGTIGVSCDMCHPNAANTHPETYPKFQVQLGRVALLRDMINWCIENPLRGKPLADDDPKIRAVEAYILAQRKGTALEYGKR